MKNYKPNNNKIGLEYLKWYYDTDVWKSTTFMGVWCQKSISDLWNYQEIIYKIKPSLIVEFGTYNGGSTLFLSNISRIANKKSKIITIDIDHSRVDNLLKKDKRIELMTCSSVDDTVKKRLIKLRKKLKGNFFIIADSDHSKKHVYNELLLLKEVLKEGDYLIVEDGIVNGNPVLPDYGEGPLEAIKEYIKKYPDDYIHDIEREKKFGYTFAPLGFLIRK